MPRSGINPGKVTKPIQLLAAWLAGLILIDGLFLGVATRLSRPEWAVAVLVVASVVNVPIFLLALFMLQTKFRAEMQEDKYYSRHLARSYSPETAKSELVSITVSEPASETIDVLSPRSDTPDASARSGATRIEINDLLPFYDDIVSALREAQVEVDRIFGSTSDEPETPDVFIISVGDGADPALLRKIIRVTINFGLNGVGRALQNLSTTRIYVGSYAYRVRPYVRATPDIVEQLLSPGLDRNHLGQILRGSPKTLVQPSDKS
jgi:hypothetical protein